MNLKSEKLARNKFRTLQNENFRQSLILYLRCSTFHQKPQKLGRDRRFSKNNPPLYVIQIFPTNKFTRSKISSFWKINKKLEEKDISIIIPFKRKQPSFLIYIYTCYAKRTIYPVFWQGGTDLEKMQAFCNAHRKKSRG